MSRAGIRARIMEARPEFPEPRLDVIQGFTSALDAKFAASQWSLISHKVFFKSFCKSQCPQKSFNLFFIFVRVEDKLTNLWEI